VRKLALTAALTLALLAATAAPALAGSPHFVDDKVTLSQDGATLTVAFKEAGLGDEDQVHVVLSATAECVNPGGNKPSAANKQTLTAEGDFPVQRGSTEGELSVTASFQPPCSPPMTVVYSSVVLTDVTSGISLAL
jgi:hypothetical protein